MTGPLDDLITRITGLDCFICREACPAVSAVLQHLWLQGLKYTLPPNNNP